VANGAAKVSHRVGSTIEIGHHFGLSDDDGGDRGGCRLGAGRAAQAGPATSEEARRPNPGTDQWIESGTPEPGAHNTGTRIENSTHPREIGCVDDPG